MKRFLLCLCTVNVLIVSACGSKSAGPDDGDGSVRDGAVDAGPDARVWPDPYMVPLFDNERITSISGEPNFQRIRADFELTDEPFEQVTLVLDLTSTCYPFDTWQTNPPPPGENWPADCDAFDRLFVITLDEPVDTGDPSALEVMRAITPFGGPMHADVDLTDVANGLPGPHTLHVYISTYSDAAGQVSGSAGGWNVSAVLDVTPGQPPRDVLAVVPLLYGTVTADATPQPISFEVPSGTMSTRLEYRVTGHGGADDPSFECIGPAEEFCARAHHVYVDDTLMDTQVPWRRNCEELCTVTCCGPWNNDYCLENPCGAIQSVRAPRANWCPGSVTDPLTWDFPQLRTPGPHTFNYYVNSLYPGGNWRVSVVYFAFSNVQP